MMFRVVVLTGNIISIHALREEGDLLVVSSHDTKKISIHALREEGDPMAKSRTNMPELFLSTPSARRATRPQRLPMRR